MKKTRIETDAFYGKYVEPRMRCLSIGPRICLSYSNDYGEAGAAGGYDSDKDINYGDEF